MFSPPYPLMLVRKALRCSFLLPEQMGGGRGGGGFGLGQIWSFWFRPWSQGPPGTSSLSLLCDQLVLYTLPPGLSGRSMLTRARCPTDHPHSLQPSLGGGKGKPQIFKGGKYKTKKKFFLTTSNLNFIHNLQAMSTSYSCTFESFSVFLILSSPYLCLPSSTCFLVVLLILSFSYSFFIFLVGFVFLVWFGLVSFSPPPHLILTSRFGVVLNRQAPKLSGHQQLHSGGVLKPLSLLLALPSAMWAQQSVF